MKHCKDCGGYGTLIVKDGEGYKEIDCKQCKGTGNAKSDK